MTVRPSVRPSAPQGHQYEVAYTGYNPVLNPVFLAQNRMFPPLQQNKQRQQKSKTNLLMEKKSSKEYPVVFLVEGEKFNLGEKN